MTQHNGHTALVPAELAEAIRHATDALAELVNHAQTHIEGQMVEAHSLGIDEQLRLSQSSPQSWLDQGKHSLQAGMMFLVRALQQPTTF